MGNNKKLVRTLIRLSLGFVFLWAFLDKLFGLAYSTAPGRSWLEGVSPTKGFFG
jgi:thiosulfate dehydrogenase [quinone] large subunit